MFFRKLENKYLTAFFISYRHMCRIRFKEEKDKVKNIKSALKHFDDFYSKIFGNKWTTIRRVLLQNQQYVALVNNFGDDNDTKKMLDKLGAFNLKSTFEIQQKFNDACNIKPKETNNELDKNVEKISVDVNKSQLEDIYKNDSSSRPEVIHVGDSIIGNEKETFHNNKNNEEVLQMHKPLVDSLKDAVFDKSRIIESRIGISSDMLHTFVPATKLHGNEEWIPESHYYNYYKTEKDFPMQIEDEEIVFPEHLNIYAFVLDVKKSFPRPKMGLTGVSNYYLVDGASMFPVLALNLEFGDRVLDLCAAPGGKTLMCLQTMLPSYLVANDSSTARTKRIQSVFKEFLYDYDTSDKWKNRVSITQIDGKLFEDQQGFDKILVDVPCTTDRHSVKENDNNIFSASRIRERLIIPEIQTELLCNALKLCKIGGSVVYSTCTFCPIQNDGVVHRSLKRSWEENGIVGTIKTHKKAMLAAETLFKFARVEAKPKYGELVIPYTYSNFGPLYFAKITRTK